MKIVAESPSQRPYFTTSNLCISKVVSSITIPSACPCLRLPAPSSSNKSDGYFFDIVPIEADPILLYKAEFCYSSLS